MKKARIKPCCGILCPWKTLKQCSKWLAHPFTVLPKITIQYNITDGYVKKPSTKILIWPYCEREFSENFLLNLQVIEDELNA